MLNQCQKANQCGNANPLCFEINGAKCHLDYKKTTQWLIVPEMHGGWNWVIIGIANCSQWSITMWEKWTHEQWSPMKSIYTVSVLSKYLTSLDTARCVCWITTEAPVKIQSDAIIQTTNGTASILRYGKTTYRILKQPEKLVVFPIKSWSKFDCWYT